MSGTCRRFDAGNIFEILSASAVSKYRKRIAVAEERELILLRYVNEVPVVVMSQLYGISRFALHRKLKAILAKLRKHFGKEADGYETEI